jgi:hypothetical protein
MAKDISNSDDCIDVRSVITRFEDLAAEIANGKEGARATWDSDEAARGELTRDAFADEYVEVNLFDEAEEIRKLTALLDDLRGNGGDHEWKDHWYPVTLIRDSYFKEYAQELAEDIGAIDPKASWPNDCIDWDKASSELKTDYQTVEFDGVTYWYR